MSIGDRSLTWTAVAPSPRELKRDGFEVKSFAELRRDLIVPARSVTSQRSTLANAASSLLDIFDQNSKVAILGVPARTTGDVSDIYSFLVEPAYRRNVTLLLEVDCDFDDLQPFNLVHPDEGYEWSLHRLRHLAQLYLRRERPDGLPALTPIESILLDAMRARSLAPQVQYGIDRYRVDFAFPEYRLAVEADGRAWHDAARDARRDRHLERLGWRTLRFTGSEIVRDPDATAEQILSAVDERSNVITHSPVEAPTTRSRWQRFLDWLLRRKPSHDFDELEDAQIESEPAQWKRELDPDQRLAVNAHEGVVQVIAPAGSGKTRVMIARVQELISNGVASNRILCTTFNRAAREELEMRLAQVGITGVEVRNFHSLGYKILKDEGLLRSEIGSISFGQWRRLARIAMDSVPDGFWLDAPVASELIGDYKLAQMIEPAEAIARATTPTERTAAELYRLYEEHLVEVDQMDFDDLVLRSVQLMRSDPDGRKRWQSKWECVLVDEYQDIEPAQELLIRLVAAPEDSIFAVGDEDQCIYSWRRASVERIVMLDTVYPGLDRIVLGTTYRCPRAVADAARQLISNNRRRFPKEIRASSSHPHEGSIEIRNAQGLREGAREVASLLAELSEAAEDAVVLARTSRLLREVVQACAERGVAVRAPEKALRLVDAEKTVLAYLRLASSSDSARPEDVRQSFRVPNRYLPREAEHVLAESLRRGVGFLDAVRAIRLSGTDEWRADAMTSWARILETLAAEVNAQSAIRTLRAVAGLDRHYSSVEQMSPHDQIEIESLDALEGEAANLASSDLVTRLELRAHKIENMNDEHGIELSTIHGAKGREWDTVILFGADADQLPHLRALKEAETDEAFEQALEDERRLAYVAITRTRRRLILIATSTPSPFLREAGIADHGPCVPTRSQVQPEREAEEETELQARPSDLSPIKAKYAGTCSNCQRRIATGDPIVRGGNSWIHERCAAQ